MGKVLIACEESQRVCMAFRKMGHDAYSCDIIEPSGGHPEWHIKGDALEIINPNSLRKNGLVFHTMDGIRHAFFGKWDLIISHPPCTYLTNTGNRWFNVERYGDKARQRYKDREEAVQFFMAFVNADCDRIAIENPIGYMSTAYRKADQIIQPYQFGYPARKATCLWLKGLPKLKPTEIVNPEIKQYKSKDGSIKSFSADYGSGNAGSASRRSKTYQGIAQAMAEQWGGLI